MKIVEILHLAVGGSGSDIVDPVLFAKGRHFILRGGGLGAQLGEFLRVALRPFSGRIIEAAPVLLFDVYVGHVRIARCPPPLPPSWRRYSAIEKLAAAAGFVIEADGEIPLHIFALRILIAA